MMETPTRTTPTVFTPLTVLWMILIGVFAFSAFVVLSAYAPDLRGAEDNGAHALSRSAVGFAGVVDLLRAEGADVVISRRPAAARDPALGLLVLTPGAGADPARLRELASAGVTLVVLPKWEFAPSLQAPGWATKVGLMEPDKVASPVSARLGKINIARRTDESALPLTGPGLNLLTGPMAQLQTLGPSAGLSPVLSDSRGGTVLAASADRKVYVLSDPDLMNTQGMKSFATARAAAAILDQARQGDGPIAFDVTLNGFGSSPSLLKFAFAPPFAGATLCLVGAALLMALHAAFRFGAPRPAGRALALGKQALADNAAGLIRLAGREPHMAPRYLDLIRGQVAHALGLGRLSRAAQDVHLDRLGEQRGVSRPLSALSAQANNARTAAELMAAARGLYQWSQEMIRERR